MAKRRILPVGSHILDDKYEIVRHIKVGKGMSNVYLIKDTALGKLWCLKEIIILEVDKERAKIDPEYRKTVKNAELEYKSLYREALIMKDLSNQNIPRIVSINQTKFSTFIVMDYIEGSTLAAWIRDKGPIKPAIAIPWMKNICSVLIYLHSRKNPIIYRDMKPPNIMIANNMSAMLIDFGISEEITPDNQIIKEKLGTPGFAAPEQAKSNAPYDLRSDIYGLGRTFYATLTGMSSLPSIPSNKLPDLKERQPSITPGLYNIVYKCMEEDPDKRFQSADELLLALENIDKQDEKYIKGLKKKRNIVAVMGALSLSIIALSFVPRAMSLQQEAEDYVNLVAVAEQSGKCEDYEAAIEMQPKVLQPYFGYIDSIKQDGVFTKDEEQHLLNLLNPVLLDVKADKQYGELAYEIGRLYWFYYDDNINSKMIQSVNWFKDAMDMDYNADKAQVFYSLGAFQRDIAKNIQESDDSGKYIKYWNDLMLAKTENSGEIMEIQVNSAILDAINSYTYRLGRDGVPLEDIKSELARIKAYIDNTTPTDGVATDMYDDLCYAYNSVSEDIDKEYNGGVASEG